MVLATKTLRDNSLDSTSSTITDNALHIIYITYFDTLVAKNIHSQTINKYKLYTFKLNKDKILFLWTKALRDEQLATEKTVPLEVKKIFTYFVCNIFRHDSSINKAYEQKSLMTIL